MGDLDKTYKPSLRSWTANVESHWDPSDTNGQQSLTVGSQVALTLYPDDNQSGDTELSGNAIVTSKERSVDLGSVISISFSVQGTGALTEGTVA